MESSGTVLAREAGAGDLRQRTRFVRGRPPRAHAGANSTLTAEHELGKHVIHVQSAGRWQESAAEPVDWRRASVLAASRQACDAAGGIERRALGLRHIHAAQRGARR